MRVPAIVFAACLAAAAEAAPLVAVDVGHFLAEPGATSARGRPELEFNRDLAVELARALPARGVGAKLIGADGDMAVLSRRNPEVERSLACASAIGARLRAAGFVPSLYHAEPISGESKPFADRENGVHYYENLVVLHSARQPAVLLEAGVIVNRAEELALRDPGTQRLIAAAVAEGVRRCLGARAL